MSARRFIASGLSFKGKAAAISVAVSFFVIIVAFAVSAGFRREIRSALGDIAGDAQIRAATMDLSGADGGFCIKDSLLEDVRGVEGVQSVEGVIYRVAVARSEGDIQTVLFKGTDRGAQGRLEVDIPRKLSRLLSLKEGDRLPCWFVSEKRTVVRNFTVGSIYEAIETSDDNLVALCDIETLRRVNGWDADEGKVSAFEVRFTPEAAASADRRQKTGDAISSILYKGEDLCSASLLCIRTENLYQDLFSWLDLIDNNSLFILIIMIVVAGVNMISGMLIMLFENIGTIGLLKSLGMPQKDINGTFLLVCARLVGGGMLWGNVAAAALCLLQKYTHLVKLEAENYFISFVPVDLDVGGILLCDAAAFAVIMLLMLIPCTFTGKVDPARTMKTL